MDIELAGKVTAVTVYSEQARVTVKAETALESGAQRLIVGDLPLSLSEGSVRAGGKGTAKVQIHGVDVRRRHYEQTPAANVRDLEARIDELEDELKAVIDEQEVLEAQGRYLDGLRGASEQFARGLALGRTSVEEQGKISQFLQDQDKALRGSTRELDRQKRDLDRALEKARRDLDQVSAARPRERNEVVIDIETLAPGQFEAELVYNVRRASWKPLYDVRLVESDEGNALEIQGLAQITQSSGQDWLDVEVQVSTARTELSRRLPDLRPWYVDVYQPPVPRAAPARMGKAAAPQALMASDFSAAQAESVAAPAMARAKAEEEGATVTFRITNNVDIPSDGSPHKTALFESRLPVEINYIAIPKQTDAVFRKMQATNEGSVPLLAGAAQLFVGERFIGTSQIDHIAPGDAIEMMLGVEERITIKRELVRREVDKARLRDKRQIQYGYEIAIKSLMPGTVNVEVKDHMPVSRHEDIKIKLLSCTPEPVEQDELNRFEWQLAVGSGHETKVLYQYQVEHPRAFKVAGLVD